MSQALFSTLQGITPQSAALLALSDDLLILHPDNRYNQGSTSRYAVDGITLTNFTGSGSLSSSAIVLVQHWSSNNILIGAYTPDTHDMSWSPSVLTIDNMVSSTTDRFVVYVIDSDRVAVATDVQEFALTAALSQTFTHNIGHTNYLVQVRDANGYIIDCGVTLGTITVTIDLISSEVGGSVVVLATTPFYTFGLDPLAAPGADQVFHHNWGHSDYIVQVVNDSLERIDADITIAANTVTVALATPIDGNVTTVAGVQCYTEAISTGAGVPQVITHGLARTEFIVQLRNAAGEVIICETVVDVAGPPYTTVTITPLTALTGTINILY